MTRIHLHGKSHVSKNRNSKIFATCQHAKWASRHISTRGPIRVSRERARSRSPRATPRIEVGCRPKYTNLRDTSSHQVGQAHTHHHGSPAVSGTETAGPLHTALRRRRCPLHARQRARVSLPGIKPEKLLRTRETFINGRLISDIPRGPSALSVVVYMSVRARGIAPRRSLPPCFRRAFPRPPMPMMARVATRCRKSQPVAIPWSTSASSVDLPVSAARSDQRRTYLQPGPDTTGGGQARRQRYPQSTGRSVFP